MTSAAPIIRFERVNKWFGRFHVLRDIDLDVARGEVLVICGPSGSGKSTLIRCVNRLERIQSGLLWVDGRELHREDVDLPRLRADIGMVFQQFNLYPHMTVLDNLTLAPVRVRGLSRSEAERVGRELLAKVDIPDKAAAYPAELSGGQQQRVAIARALVTQPALLLADEPTGNLDTESSLEIMRLLSRLNEEGRTIVLITHEHDIAAFARRVVRVQDGRILSDARQAPHTPAPPPTAEVSQP